MRIVIDMQGAQTRSRFRGIGRYSMELALALAQNPGGHEIWLILNGAFPESALSIRHTFEGLIPQERIRVFEIPTPVAEVERANTWRARTAEKIREHFLLQFKPDIVLVTSLFEGYADDAATSIDTFSSRLCTAVIVYDLIPLLNQRDYLANEIQRNYYLRKVQYLKNADLLLAISEATRNEAIEALQTAQNKIVNISAAAEGQFRSVALTQERINQLQNHYGVARKMVMYAPGGFDQRKNFEGLISAYSMLASKLRAEHQLVIVGNLNTDKQEYLKKLAISAGLSKDELIITGYMPDEELVDFYNLATLFVFPSKHEGFGLPALEAMACGTPVIGSNCTSIPETIGLPDALFDPFSPQDIAEKMGHALSDPSFRDRLRAYGLNQAKNFTWDKCARRTINALEKLVHANSLNLAATKAQERIPELLESIANINAVAKPTDADLVLVADCVAFNTGRATPKQLFLDISEIVRRDSKSGIQRVVRSLLRELIENPPHGTEVRPIYFDGIHYKFANAFTSVFTGNPSQEKADEIVDFCQDDTYLALDLNAHLTESVHDIHKCLQRRGIKLYFIIYDILLVQHPEWWPKGTNVIFNAWLHSISEVATGLICISDSVAKELCNWLEQNPPQRPSCPLVSNFCLGADVKSSVPSSGLPYDVQTKLAAFKRITSFLMVGTIEPRKGHEQALAAFELLWKQGINANLVIVGKQGWLVDKLVEKIRHHPELNRRLFWLEGISDEYLEMVYATCNCLIAASFGEGFGLPLIEAAQHKKFIIARDLPVFHEVAGKHAFYFKGDLPENLADSIITWLHLSEKDMNPKTEGMQYINWRESAEQLKELLDLNMASQ